MARHNSIKHVQSVRENHVGIQGGLDFWPPNLNIYRDPRWGRGRETYVEDPFLTARMGVAFVTVGHIPSKLVTKMKLLLNVKA